jgi:hypothetical protein
MAGWDGPMLSSRLSGRASFSILVGISISQTNQRLALPQGVIFAERIALKASVHKEPAVVRMAFEAYPEHVQDLSFQPVGVLPQPSEGIDAKVLLREPRF